MPAISADESLLFLSTLPAGEGDRRVARAALIASVAIFAVLAPLAKTPLPPWPPFIAIYESALVINDLITAVFMFSQFHILRSRPLLYLASGYLFTAFLAVAHALTFPGLFSPTGLLGAGPQSTAWLYMFWHAGFPLLVIAYALHQDPCEDGTRRRVGDRALVLLCVGAALVAAGGLALLATAGQDMLPALMAGNQYTFTQVLVILSVWGSSFVALLALWRRRSRSVLDLWLMVVLCAWVFDIALSGVLNAARFDLGFYAGRIYGLIATSLVLVMLLLESGSLYLRLIDTHRSDREKSAKLEQLSATDALTGIANRRTFEQALDQEWRRTMRHSTPLSLLMIDVDFFKRFNDTYGHVAGDDCLRSVAKALANNARRAGELASRYGGEEFAVLLPLVEVDEAHQLAERICNEVRGLGIPHEASEVADHVTISVGVASVSMILGSKRGEAACGGPEARAGMSRPPSAVLVELADEALYAAKTGGRNRAVSAQIDALIAPSPRRSAR